MTDHFFREARGRAFADFAKEHPEEFRDERFMEMSVRGAAQHLGVCTAVAALLEIPVDNTLPPQAGKATEGCLLITLPRPVLQTTISRQESPRIS